MPTTILPARFKRCWLKSISCPEASAFRVAASFRPRYIINNMADFAAMNAVWVTECRGRSSARDCVQARMARLQLPSNRKADTKQEFHSLVYF